ncbi:MULTISPECIES: heme A synthase [unclassified Actinotalea]|uniref:COX15/CtaA family protein n=1 Tax=unclassified Actinotalea TaxID=2638618 RepID=UPI0015F5262B|nr:MULTISPECIES: COX15/CtaA family protein [unclassified Actinotalea]
MSSTTAPSATTSPAGPSRSSWRHPSAAWRRRVLIANLAAQVLIVGTGGAVRLTGSGLGCSTWPQCEPGEFAPVMHEATSYHSLVEFGNRTLTGVLAVLAIAAAWVVWQRTDRTRAFRWLGLTPLLGVAVQAVVGGITVLVDLHPGVVAVHFLVSMALVAVSALLLARDREGDGAPVPTVPERLRRLALALVPILVVVLVLGVVTTGAGPHSGDDEVAYRFAVDPVLVARLHAASVWLYLALILAVLVLLRRADAGARRATVVLLVAALAQGLVGYAQYFTGLPAVLVGIHMLGASVLVIAQVRQTVALRVRA